MKKTILLLSFLVCIQISFAQFFSSASESKKYSAKKVIDPDYGITMYEKLNFQTGGDSVRNNSKGYVCEGWVEDFYDSGEQLHRGYYEEGHLKIYKNFFPNGTVERSFKVTDLKRCSMQIFYPDGKIKSDISYYNGNPQVWTDYYPNGQIEYTEENTKSMEYLINRKSYTKDGKPQEIFELTDQKKKLYSKKEYYENGAIKAEGVMKFNPALVDYQKEGIWMMYDEKGTMTKEKWDHGEEQK